jgi:hypothetical protein
MRNFFKIEGLTEKGCKNLFLRALGAARFIILNVS